jgi:hypothetical protein
MNEIRHRAPVKFSSKPPEVSPYEHQQFTADQAHRAQIFSVEGPQALKGK